MNAAVAELETFVSYCPRVSLGSLSEVPRPGGTQRAFEAEWRAQTLKRGQWVENVKKGDGFIDAPQKGDGRLCHGNQSPVLIPEAFFPGNGVKCSGTPAAFPSEKFMLVYTKRGATPEKVQLQKTRSHLNRQNMTMKNWALLKSSEGWSNVPEHS